MRKWNKVGQIFQMSEIHPLLKTHASNPLPVRLSEDIYRIFFSGRDSFNRSSVGYVDFNMNTLKQVNICSEPLLQFGSADSFYSHGISIGNMYSVDDHNYILYMGWNIPKGEHWRGDIGQLELINNNQLIHTSNSPFMTIDEEDKVSLSYPFVSFHNGIYKMWYGSTLSWKEFNGEMLHVIKYATSLNGKDWTKHGLAIPYELGLAQAFSRPSVVMQDQDYHMWYSYRSGDGSKYRIGYAKSLNGIDWKREHDFLGLTVSNSGWDSEMVCYPFVFEYHGKMYMLYNGNQFGKEGFGLAILD